MKKYTINIDYLEEIVKALQKQGVDIKLENFFSGDEMKWLVVGKTANNITTTAIISKNK